MYSTKTSQAYSELKSWSNHSNGDKTHFKRWTPVSDDVSLQVCICLHDDLWQFRLIRWMFTFRLLLLLDSVSLRSFHKRKTEARWPSQQKILDTHRRATQCSSSPHNFNHQPNVQRAWTTSPADVLQRFHSATWGSSRHRREHRTNSV